MHVDDVILRGADDLGIFLLDRHVEIIDDHLDVRMIDLGQEFEGFRTGVDDVALLLAEWLDANHQTLGFGDLSCLGEVGLDLIPGGVA